MATYEELFGLYNNAATVVNITGATDVAIQANVDGHIDLFADGS